MKNKTKAIITIFTMLLMVLPLLSGIPLVQADAPNVITGMELERVYVKIRGGDGAGRRSSAMLQYSYEASFGDAKTYWETGYRKLPWDLWEDGGTSFATFDSQQDFYNWWIDDDNLEEQVGRIFILDTEYHVEYWSGAYTTIYGDSEGNVCCDKNFRAYAYARFYTRFDNTVPFGLVLDLPTPWFTNVMKHLLGRSVGMLDCPFWFVTNCLMDEPDFSPMYNINLCLWCANIRLPTIKRGHGW